MHDKLISFDAGAYGWRGDRSFMTLVVRDDDNQLRYRVEFYTGPHFDSEHVVCSLDEVDRLVRETLNIPESEEC